MRLLIVNRVQDLSGTERARDELFHLMEAVHQSGGRVVFAADRAPSRISGIDDRARRRLEAGLVLEAESDDVPDVGPPAPEPSFDPVLGGHVLDEDALADFPDIGGGLPEESRQESGAAGSAAPAEGLLDFDPQSLDDFDALLASGSSSAAGAFGSFRDADEAEDPTEVPETDHPATDSEGMPDDRDASVPDAASSLRWSPTSEEVVWAWNRVDDLMVQEWTGRNQTGGAGRGA